MRFPTRPSRSPAPLARLFGIAGSFAVVMFVSPVSAHPQSPSSTTEAAQQAKQAACRELLADAESARSSLVTLDRAVKEYQSVFADLLKSDLGRRLGASDGVVAGILDQPDHGAFKPGAVQEAVSRLDAFISEVKEQRDDPAQPVLQVSPFPRIEQEGCERWANYGLAVVRQRAAWLEVKKSEAEKKALSPAELSALPTLQDAIEALRLRRQAEEQERVALEARKKKEEIDAVERKRLAELEAQRYAIEKARERILEQIELLRSREALNRLAEREAKAREGVAVQEEKLKDDERQRERDAMQRALQSRCRDAETVGLLRPFLDKGTAYYAWKGNGAIKQTFVEPKPYSLSYLQTQGALEKTETGLQHLICIAAEPKDTDRRRWSRWSGNDDSTNAMRKWAAANPSLYQEYSRAQALLIELGPTLVELGMLEK